MANYLCHQICFYITIEQIRTSIEVYKHAAKWADGIIVGSENLDSELEEYVRGLDKPLLEFQSEDSYVEEYNNFYDSVLSEGESEED